MLYALYIYDRHGTCLYYAEWGRTKKVDSLEGNQRLMYGMLYSLKRWGERTNPESDVFVLRTYATSAYRLHYLETATGLRFVVLSDLKVLTLMDELEQLYGIYVETAVKNPLYVLGTPITCTAFAESVTQFVEGSKHMK